MRSLEILFTSVTMPKLRKASFIRSTRRIHMCACDAHQQSLSHSFIRATWLIDTCDMTHSYVRHDSSIHATWLIYSCDMTHSYERHDSSTCANVLLIRSTQPITCAQELATRTNNLFVAWKADLPRKTYFGVTNGHELKLARLENLKEIRALMQVWMGVSWCAPTLCHTHVHESRHTDAVVLKVRTAGLGMSPIWGGYD